MSYTMWKGMGDISWRDNVQAANVRVRLWLRRQGWRRVTGVSIYIPQHRREKAHRYLSWRVKSSATHFIGFVVDPGIPTPAACWPIPTSSLRPIDLAKCRHTSTIFPKHGTLSVYDSGRFRHVDLLRNQYKTRPWLSQTDRASAAHRIRWWHYTVTLKSRLQVTQGHWKRNHWIEHTRLSSSRIIWRWILSWP